MKPIFSPRIQTWFWILFLSCSMHPALRLTAAEDPLLNIFQQGLFEEEANRDLNAAIEKYQDVLNQIEAKDNEGQTPLHHASRIPENSAPPLWTFAPKLAIWRF